MKKRLWVTLLAGILVFGLAACEREGTSEMEEVRKEEKITNIEEAYETEIPVYVTEGLTRPIFAEGDGGYQVCIQNTNRRV